MEDRLDYLFQEWHELGGAVLLAEKRPSQMIRSPEEVIAESTAYGRESSRLLWIVVGWLIDHIEQIDAETLIQKSLDNGDMSVLGVMCDIAYQRKAHPKFKQIMAACKPHAQVEPFFKRVARSPLATRLAQDNGLAVFRRWNYWCRELRYL